jgi:ATP-dependent helicase IRC3
MKPRFYQKEAIQASRNDLQAGHLRQLIVMAVGGGKSLVIAHLTKLILEDHRAADGRAIILTHREILGTQNKEKLLIAEPALDGLIGTEKAQNRCQPTDRVMMASVQTVGKEKTGPDRIRAWCPLHKIKAIFIDEAHHAAGGKSYQNVLNTILEANPHLLVVGFTATPKRGDGERLDKIFTRETYKIELDELIKLKFLVPFRGWKIHTETRLEGIQTQAGDFKIKDLEERVNVTARNRLAVEVQQKRHPGQTAMAFCVDKAHAKSVAEEFNQAGIPAETITEDTDPEHRAGLKSRLDSGQTQVVCCVETLTEGFDYAKIMAIHMLRPTKSPVLFMQILGRGSRPVAHPNPEDPDGEWLIDWDAKPCCHFYDYVDIKGEEMGAYNLARIAGLAPQFKTDGVDVFAIKEQIDAIAQTEPLLAAALRNAQSKEEIRLLWEPHDLLTEIKRINYVKSKGAKLRWIDLHDEYWVQLKHGELVKLTKNALGQFQLALPKIDKGKRQIKELERNGHHLDPEEKSNLRKNQIEAQTIILPDATTEKALSHAADIVLQQVPEDKNFITLHAPWRKRTANDEPPQWVKNFLRRNKIPNVDKLKRAEADELHDKITATRNIHKEQGRFHFGKYKGIPIPMVALFAPDYLHYLKREIPRKWKENEAAYQDALEKNPLEWLEEYNPKLYKKYFGDNRKIANQYFALHPQPFRELVKNVIRQDPLNEWSRYLKKEAQKRT